MRVIDRIRTVSGAIALVSAAWAMLLGGVLLFFSLKLLLVDPCPAPPHGQYLICDSPVPPGMIEFAVLALLVLAGILNVVKGWLWPLLGAWTLIVGFYLADAIVFLFPWFAVRVGFHGEIDGWQLLEAKVTQPVFLVFVLGLSLAVVSAFAARRHKKY